MSARSHRWLIAAAVLALALGLAAESPAATDDGVSIVFRAYQPATTTVNVGETVTWTNQALVPHTVTAVAGAFNSGKLNAGQSFSVTFSTPGTYLYACLIHPSMKGTVIVRSAQAPPAQGPGSPTGHPQALQVHLSRHRSAHGSRLVVHVTAPRPGARASLELRKGSTWRRVAQATLSAQGTATLSVGSTEHPLRVVVLGQPGEAPLTSPVLRPPA